MVLTLTLIINDASFSSLSTKNFRESRNRSLVGRGKKGRERGTGIRVTSAKSEAGAAEKEGIYW